MPFQFPGDSLKQNGEMNSSCSSFRLRSKILDDICGIINCANANLPLDGFNESENVERRKLLFISDREITKLYLPAHAVSCCNSFEKLLLSWKCSSLCLFMRPKLDGPFWIKIQFSSLGKNFDGSSVHLRKKNPRHGTTERGLRNQNPHSLNLNFIQASCLAISKRTFLYHAVAVLKSWLFEHLSTTPTLQTRKSKPWHSRQVYQGLQPRSTQNQNEYQTKRLRNELADVSKQRQEPRNICVKQFVITTLLVLWKQRCFIALGLPQNNRTDQSWPLPMSIPHHVNLEMISMMDSAPGTGFELQKQHFGKD
ncbi:LOW QUALITY PROTEIN: hypothetical protein NC651_019099 [Populus alba x Populus x berolinensis]|nr:LOW QUALITY PROTEIN: hypothetical protein NC651_019099 [Populus alba x Populus x berolinensis]